MDDLDFTFDAHDAENKESVREKMLTGTPEDLHESAWKEAVRLMGMETSRIKDSAVNYGLTSNGDRITLIKRIVDHMFKPVPEPPATIADVPFDGVNLSEIGFDPACQVIGRFDHQSPEWLRLRRDYIGSSDVSVLVGQSPFSDVEELIKEKKDGATRDDRFLRPYAEFGKWMEDRIRRELNGGEIVPGEEIGMIVNQKFPHSAVNVDGVLLRTSGSEGIEIKTASTTKEKQHHRTQCQFQMLLTGLSTWNLVVFVAPADRKALVDLKSRMPPEGVTELEHWMIRHGEIKIHRIEADPEYQAHIAETVGIFWDTVNRGEKFEPVLVDETTVEVCKAWDDYIIHNDPMSREGLERWLGDMRTKTGARRIHYGLSRATYTKRGSWMIKNKEVEL